MSIINGFYVPNEILTMKDARGKDPMVRFITGNRTAGKSFGVKLNIVRQARKHGGKFGVLTRHKNALPLIPASFTKDFEIKRDMAGFNLSAKHVGDAYDELYYEDKHVGFSVPLSSDELIKLASSAFVDTTYWIFDEAQLKDPSKYLKNEGDIFHSFVTSVARGGGKHIRYVQFFVVSNTYSVFNPLFVHYGIHKLLKPDTKFLRGDGWVLEQMYNPDAAEALEEAGLGGNSREAMSALHNVYVLDSDAFIQKLPGEKRLMFTIMYHGVTYGVYTCGPLVYVGNKAPENFPILFAITKDEHNVTTTLIGKSSPYRKWLVNAYEAASIRFESPLARDAALTLMGAL